MWFLPLSRNMQSTIPSVPERDSSLHGPVTKDEELLFLAGRKPYTYPSGSRTTQLTVSTSSTSLTSEGAGLSSNLAEGDTMDRLFNGSSMSLAISEDSTSMQSATSDLVGGGAQTPETGRRGLSRASTAPTHSQTSLKPASAATRPESPNPPRYSSHHGHVTRPESPNIIIYIKY